MNEDFILEVADAIENDSLNGVTFDMSDFVTKDRDGKITADITGYALMLSGKLFSLKEVQNCTITNKLPNHDWYDVLGRRVACNIETEKLFDVHGDLITELCDPEGYELCSKKNVDITREDTALVLRHLADTGEVDWGLIDV